MTDKPSKILIVEDDRALNQGLVLSLKNDSYTTLSAFSIKEAREKLTDNTFDLIVLDVNLPDGNGLELCQEIRRRSAVPIIFLTANDMEMDVVIGLESGGDDYITKPFSLAILRARIAALLRRSRIVNEHRLTVGSTVLDYDSLSVTTREGTVELPKKEFLLLFKLLSYQNKIFTRRQLMDEIWDMDSESDERTVDVHINRLRDRFRSDPDFEIVTVRGLGYKAVKRS